MKGADQCPRCGCRKTGKVQQQITPFYAGEITICANCGTAWEAFDPAQLLDRDDPLSSFVDPCDNCAFRPGSPEQQDREKWQDLVAKLKAGGAFFCHKGVPLDPEGEDGFAYPADPNTGKQIVRKLRYCRGWLRMVDLETWANDRP